LTLCIEWFNDNLNLNPTVWATPWGSEGNDIMKKVAKELYLQIEGTRGTVSPQRALDYMRANSLDSLGSFTVMEHWWKKGTALLRICDCARLGSYAAAVEDDKKQRTHMIFPENTDGSAK
jgi:hypothetical protein